MEHERGGVSPPARASPPSPSSIEAPRPQLVYMRHARRASRASATERADSGAPHPPGLHPVVSVDERRRSSVVHRVLGVDMNRTCRCVCSLVRSVPDLHTSSGRRSRQHSPSQAKRRIVFWVALCPSLPKKIKSYLLSLSLADQGGGIADPFFFFGDRRHLTEQPRPRPALVAEMVGNIRFLTLVKPVLHVLPEVAQPDRKIPFKVRLPAEPMPLSRTGCSGVKVHTSTLGCPRIAGEDPVDRDHAVHLPGLLPNPHLRLQD